MLLPKHQNPTILIFVHNQNNRGYREDVYEIAFSFQAQSLRALNKYFTQHVLEVDAVNPPENYSYSWG